MSEMQQPRESGTFHKMRFTPLRDVLRFRLTNRMDIETILQQHELPGSCCDVVRAVVKRSRLWRLEKANVAAELAAHFRDGLDAGASEEELIENFGDVQQTAKLIRNSKIRCRSFLWHACHRAWQATMVFVVIYVLLIGYFLLGKPNVKTNYLKQINTAAEAVPEKDRAWPLYREVAIKICALSSDGWPENKLLHDATAPGKPRWPETVIWLHEHRTELEMIRTAAGKPGLGYITRPGGIAPEDHALQPTAVIIADPYAKNESINSTSVAHLGVLRVFQLAFLADLRLAIQEHDIDRILSDFTALDQMAKHAEEIPFIISSVMAMSIRDRAILGICEAIQTEPTLFKDAQLTAMAHRLAALDFQEMLIHGMKGQKLFMADLLQRIYTDDGTGNGHMTLAGFRLLHQMETAHEIGQQQLSFLLADNKTALTLALPTISAVMADRRSMLEMDKKIMDLNEASFRIPMYQEPVSPAVTLAIQMYRDWKARMRYSIVTTYSPALGTNREMAARISASRDGALIGIVLNLYHRHEGHWPEQLDDLVPRYLPLLPVDPITGGHLLYKMIDDKPVVYSVGTNGKDDGGIPTKNPNDAKNWRFNPEVRNPPESVKGDWILWPLAGD